jgi:hypothetical protein
MITITAVVVNEIVMPLVMGVGEIDIVVEIVYSSFVGMGFAKGKNPPNQNDSARGNGMRSISSG